MVCPEPIQPAVDVNFSEIAEKPKYRKRINAANKTALGWKKN